MGRRTERKRDEKRDRKEQYRAVAGLKPLPEPKPADVIQAQTINKALAALNEAQGHYLISMNSKPLTFGIGPAGTGKTHLCVVKAARMLIAREVTQIIVTRPMVTAGKGAGFLPGELDEKFAPFFEPILNILGPILGKSHVENLMRNEKIVAKPLDYIRGLTFDNAFVILDEAQNTTPEQMKLFLTRIGKHSRVVVNGDVSQQDIPGLSGLQDALNRLQGLGQVGIIEFTEDDIVRSGLVREILIRYRNKGRSNFS
jgi:phosphate starvation-inducible protein PhoH and related proteins